MNLLEETIEILDANGKNRNDIKWIGTNKGYIEWDMFEKEANKEYDSGFGSNEVNLTLKIVGNDWWLERVEYDGSEWWEFKTLPAPSSLRAECVRNIWENCCTLCVNCSERI